MKKIKFICAILVGMTFSASSMKSNESGDSNDKVGETISTNVESLKSAPKGSKERTFFIECIPYFCTLIPTILVLIFLEKKYFFRISLISLEVILTNLISSFSLYIFETSEAKISYNIKEFFKFMVSFILLYICVSNSPLKATLNEKGTISLIDKLLRSVYTVITGHEKTISLSQKRLEKLLICLVMEMFFFVPKIIADYLYFKNDSVSDKSFE